MKKLLLIFLLSPLLILGQQQTVGLFFNEPSAYNGYTLFNSSGSKTTYLIDNCGYKLYEWNSNFRPGLMVYLLEDGNLLRTKRLNNTVLNLGGSGGGIEILDPFSNVIWQYEVNSDSTLSHHDLEFLPNGNILILAVELISENEANDYGSLVTADRYSEMILEVNPTNNQIVWQWRAWDHLIQDTDTNLPNYGIISQNPNRLNVNYNTANLSNNPDWIHANSLDYNSDLDQIIINSASWGEFWIIDHSTTILEASDSVGGYSGKGGDILYRWGNPQTYQRGSSIDQVFEFQHDAHWIPSSYPDEGKIMVFNNGQQREYSSIDIIEPPLDTNNFNNYSLTNNDPYSPQSLFWTYSDSANFYSPKISGSQQLENGNILICSGNQGRIFEIEHQTDSVVWDYIMPIMGLNPIIQGDVASNNNVFRAHRFSSSYSGFNNLLLTPSAVIELYPLTSNCEIYISGCTDPLACNYDSLANVNDSICYYNSASYDTLVSAISINWNGIILSSSGDYLLSLVNSVGCDSIANINFTFNTTTSMISYTNTYRKKLINIVDILGKTTTREKKKILFYIYDDGTVEKRMFIE